MACMVIQRQFCAAQLAYNNMKALEKLTGEIQALESKVAALQSDETALFNPNGDKAQIGDGAEE